MEFNKAYSRQEFVNFLQNSFLPEDFIHTETPVEFRTKMTYTRHALKLGTSAALDLVVYEVRHNSKNDARVSLSKEAFRLLADEMEDRALVVFVPEDNNDNYRFSLIEITLESKNDSSRVTRNYSNPRRYSYFLGKGIAYYTPNKYLNEKGRVVDSDDLRSRFSVEVLTKEFYQELSDWYAWAIKIIRFPNDLNDKTDDDKFNNESAIRLITRLIFVWFLKQRHLIPDEFFDEAYLSEKLLKNFKPYQMGGLLHDVGEVKYYTAILQNLFFAMLNSPITPEGGKELSERHFRKLNEQGKPSSSDYDNNKLMRYESYFKNPQLFVDLANRTVPFLNGGLFDCLDDKDKGIYYDGFSDSERSMKSLYIPDFLFFVSEIDVDLSVWYNDKRKKKVKVRGIINILKRYNFTVEENTPFDKEVSLDPELLGKVFENLLASYNPETQTTARKQTGSFYTPREIVQYMVDESLVAHLKRTVGDDLEQQYRQLMQYTDEDVSLTDNQRRQIMLSLYNCKVLDPACGSGAFPMGILQQMVHILSRIDPDNKIWKEIMLQKAIDETSEAYRNSSNEERKELIADIERSFDESINRPDYARKLYLIENCIYGVDIQPIAIQISKLRFFISLVVDQNTNTDPTDNFGIRPLPNLEAKFVAANTLIGLQKKDASLFDSEKIKAKENELKIAKHKIFGAKTVRTKRKYKNIVNELRQEIADMLYANGAVGNDEARQLASWDMFDQNDYSKFFDPEWMFGVKDGFDIVIGNPPYVQLQANNGRLSELYEQCGYKTFVRTGDIYILFYERGWQLLKSGGCLCYITSNKWMRAGYGEKTRSFFAKYTNPELLIDFSGVDVFESATVVTNVLLFTRGENKGITYCVGTSNKYKDCLKNLTDYVEKNEYIQNLKTSDGWVILTPVELSIKNKIIVAGTSLSEWNIKINYGIKTGYNDAFIIDSVQRDEILNNCQTESERKRTAEIIRPILRGRDIKRYGYEWAGKYLIATFPSRSYDIEQYPAVKQYLLSFGKERLEQTGRIYTINGEKVKSRKKTNNKWFETQDSISYWEDFLEPKVIYPETTKSARFAYDESGIFIDKTCFMLISNDALYLQKTLSSKLFEVAYNRMFSSVELVNHTYQYNKYALVKLPIIKDKNAIKKLSEIDDEKKIDFYVYKLYGLTYDEVLIVDPQTPITREEYEK